MCIAESLTQPPASAYAEFHCLSSEQIMEERHTFSGEERLRGKRENSFFPSSVKCAAASEENYLMKVTKVTLREATGKFLGKKMGERIPFFKVTTAEQN